jgi:2-hydroxychromene-2-carboxylate isomerase
MIQNTMLMTIVSVALGIAGAVSSAQAGDNQSVAAAHAATKDMGGKGAFGRTRLILIQRSYYEGSGRSQSTTGPFNPDIWDDFEGYPHPK